MKTVRHQTKPMPPKGSTHLSMAERDEKTAELDEKIKKFTDDLATVDASKPNKELISKHFGAKDLSALWKRLELARGKAPSTIAESWEGLKN